MEKRWTKVQDSVSALQTKMQDSISALQQDNTKRHAENTTAMSEMRHRNEMQHLQNIQMINEMREYLKKITRHSRYTWSAVFVLGAGSFLVVVSFIWYTFLQQLT